MAVRGVRCSSALLVALGALIGTAVVASAAHTSFFPPFTSGVDVYTAFPMNSSQGTGPIGMIDDGTHFFVTDVFNATLYRFASGAAGSAASPQASAANGLQVGLAFTQGGYYGLSRGGHAIPAGLYQFNPGTLAVMSTTPIVAPAGQLNALARDPVTGDLYISSTSGIFHVTGLGSTPSATTFASGTFDGLDFSPDGSVLYAASHKGTNHVVGFTRTGASSGFDVDFSSIVPDGIVVAPPNTIVNGVDVSKNVFVNGNSGEVDRIDVNHGNAVSTVATGGTRGDFATVGADGCLYVTQSTTVERLSPCFFQPATVIPESPLAALLPAGAGLAVIGAAVAGTVRRRRSVSADAGR